jgi:hypothetical protein
LYLKPKSTKDCSAREEEEQAVGSEWDVTNLIDGAEEKAAIQLVTSAQLRKTGDQKSFLSTCGEEKSDDRSSGDHVNQKRR